MTLVFVGILFGNTMSALDGSIVATAAPTIIGELGTVALLPWLTTSYLLAQVCTMALYGKLGDLFGRKRIFTFAIATFLAGSVACGAAQSMEQLVAFRVLQGIGAGGITGLSMALVADVVRPGQARSLPRLHGARLRADQRPGPARGRPLRRQPLVALGLLHQRAQRHHLPRHPRVRAPSGRPHAPPPRLAGGVAAGGGGGRAPARPHPHGGGAGLLLSSRAWPCSC